MDFTPHARPLIALDVLRAIDKAIAEDGGATFRMLLRKWIPLAEDAYRGKEKPFREHLGASVIGERCERLIWYTHRWAVREELQPRMVRLLNRGHLEEARFTALLEMIGYSVATQDVTGKQNKLSLLDGNFGGSCDALLRVASYLAVGEFKTHNRKSFEHLAGKLDDWRAHVADDKAPFTGQGVRVSKFKHYAQSQVYVHGFGAGGALYLAVCKDTDDLYAEWLRLDSACAAECSAKAQRVIASAVPPPKINASPGWHECRFCKARKVCHLGAKAEINCRTCRHGRPSANGTWFCAWHATFPASKPEDVTRDSDAQLRGCPEHSFIPELLPGRS